MSSHSPAAERDYSAVTAVLPEYRGPFPGTEVNKFLISSWGIDFLNPENETSESLEPTTSKNSVSPAKDQVKVIVTRKPRKSANLKVTRFKENLITKIIPSDEVESALETMFESDRSVSYTTVTSIPSAPVSSKSCKTVSDLVAESVEKILKSPSPKKMDETFSPADFKRVSNGVSIMHNLDRNSSASVNLTNGSVSKKWNNTPEKNKENSQPHSNGKIQPAKSQLELALTGKGVKCDKPDVEKSASNYRENTSKVSNRSESKERNEEEETYVEVESELAKMFAGIEDVQIETTTDTVAHHDSTSTSNGISNVTKSTSVTTNTSSTNPLPNSIDEPTSCNSSYHDPMSSANNISTKPRKNVQRKRVRKPKPSVSSVKNSKTKQISGKENSSLDSATLKRVPVIHIEGSKENPISVQIINSIKTEEEDSSENKTATKRKSGKIDRPSKKLATDYVLKNYDPSSSDSSWMCIFCKLYAYTTTESGEPMGDLFGPYFIRDPNRGENERLSNPEETRKKKRVENACVDTSLSEEKSLEIWAHENCFLWAPGVHLIGSKLMGLEEAVWDSQKVKCARCGQDGANIGCKTRLCKSFMHYGCAVLAGWKLDVDKFLSICNLHAGPD